MEDVEGSQPLGAAEGDRYQGIRWTDRVEPRDRRRETEVGILMEGQLFREGN